jgi:hypothetical protein
MQALLGSLLTAGYATAMARQISDSGQAAQVTEATQGTLQKSFSGAVGLGEQYPQYASEIAAAARESFLSGANWAYAAAIAAGLLAMAIVRFAYPGKQGEIHLLQEYAEQDAKTGGTGS